MLAACAFSPRSEPCPNVTFCLLSDATVHPPVSETHPYENLDPASMPPDMGYGCKMVDGVMHVYTTRKTMEKWDLYDGSLSARMLYLVVLRVEGFLSVFKHFVGSRVSCLSFDVANRSTELDLPYPDLHEYIADMNVMMALIINGPV